MTGTRWKALGTTVHVVVADPAALQAAERLVRAHLDELDAACSRFRDSELTRLRPGRQRVGPVLRDALAAALAASAATDGLVDPTLGRALAAAGYDRTFAALPADGPPAAPGPVGRWREVVLDGEDLHLPDVELDLGATAKAWAADRAAHVVAARLGTSVLVNLGGDLAAVGGSWPVAVGDPGGATEVVEVSGGLATSSTVRRRWLRDGRPQHHVIDPGTGRPARTPWRTVTVAAASCLEANVASTAAVVLGRGAVEWLGDLPARLVDARGVTWTHAWSTERAA